MPSFLSSSLLSLLALGAISSAAPLVERQSDIPCTGAYIIWARGSYEDANNSTLLPFVNWVQFLAGGSNYEVQYPATIIPTGFQPDYQDSVQQGITDMINHIEAYANACPNSNGIVLAGFSQGGQVVSDTLGGNSYDSSYILPSQYWKYIRAAVAFGDPTFSYPASYDAGNSTVGGIFKRNSGTASSNNLQYWGNRFQSYCQEYDFFCSDGNGHPEALAIHVVEVNTWLTPARTFALKQFGITNPS